jgi:DNA-binding transcriptional LysR family regulator
VTAIATEGRVQVATADGVIACVKAGLGIAGASRWMCRAELQTGELVSILSDYQLESIELSGETEP